MFCFAPTPPAMCLAVRAAGLRWLGAAAVFALLALTAMLLPAQRAHAAEPVFSAVQSRPLPAREQPWPHNSFIVLSYHDVDDRQADQRFLAVTTHKLVAELAWLRENGYQAVSVQQILDAHEGKTPLPPKAILLTFDDGYRSFYTRVFPLLKSYQWPALLAPVGHWVGAPDTQPEIDFGGLNVPRKHFSNWEEIREVHASGLVEIAAHTQNLHFGHVANPQGNTQPAAATLRYDPSRQRYETPAEFEQRLDADIRTISRNIEAATGQAPRAWVWPYGTMNGKAWALAKAQGYRLSFSLDEGLAHASQLDNIPRFLMGEDQSLEQFASAIVNIQQRSPQRITHVDLDYIYDPDPAQQEKNLGQLVQRIHDLRITTVYLQAFADPEGDGLVRSVYFPNRVLPMRADLFNRVAWQLRSRAGVKVFAWMPVLSFNLDSSYPRIARAEPPQPDQLQGKTLPPHDGGQDYPRLSLFDPRVRQAIQTLYADLAWHAPFSGIVFHDDALLREDEDVSAPALAAYRAAGFEGPFPKTDASQPEQQRWMRFKTKALTDFTLELLHTVRAIRGADVQSARNLYVNTLLQPESERWFAQNYQQALSAYDWVAPMVMPLMEQVPEAKILPWLDQVVASAARIPGALDKTIFEIQSVDWRKSGAERAIAPERLAQWLRRLSMQGAQHLGYYPDDFIGEHPPQGMLRRHFSLYWFPAP
ncbi:poly-beta-1,6-N-acetyl-D-glucosamine N-deacetylase PgaB [Vandammella animalimorsus]|uniref:Poly-beta-1,6-N-acetyl-D-glucosamine N-deacetylase PgaB n=2 Tax=Vandammella animalimorsus TaxID=2029117 RepID=A0A2A2B005_9BURK|nr:poly-beta-1,6-N-acetyl-D-glucosamine N-deacetylase PgaB [Vandammella animalimorsus]